MTVISLFFVYIQRLFDIYLTLIQTFKWVLFILSRRNTDLNSSTWEVHTVLLLRNLLI